MEALAGRGQHVMRGDDPRMLALSDLHVMARADDLSTALTAAGFDLENAQDRQSLALIVACQPEDRSALSERLRKVQILALTEWLEWAVARRRGIVIKTCGLGCFRRPRFRWIRSVWWV